MKGLNSDVLEEVEFRKAGDGLPNDRRFAFLFTGAEGAADFRLGEWLHKKYFMSAFSNTDLVASWKTAFDDTTSTLTVRPRRTSTKASGRGATASKLLAASLTEPSGVAAAEDFFANACEQPVALVDGGESAPKHQFGNTNSGLKANGDLRVVHIVNVNTVRALADAAGVRLDPRRFRPNIILDGTLPPFAEFGWVGGTVRIGEHVTLRVIKRTVRCDAVTLWAPDADGDLPKSALPASGDHGGYVDVPELLTKHFPQHGPYLGVYAQVETTGTICTGDAVVPLPRAPDTTTKAAIPWVWRFLCGLALALVAAYVVVVYFPAM